MESIKIGDFFIQYTKNGNILRKVVSYSDFSLTMMFDTFDNHGYYPISVDIARVIGGEVLKLELVTHQHTANSPSQDGEG